MDNGSQGKRSTLGGRRGDRQTPEPADQEARTRERARRPDPRSRRGEAETKGGREREEAGDRPVQASFGLRVGGAPAQSAM